MVAIDQLTNFPWSSWGALPSSGIQFSRASEAAALYCVSYEDKGDPFEVMLRMSLQCASMAVTAEWGSGANSQFVKYRIANDAAYPDPGSPTLTHYERYVRRRTGTLSLISETSSIRYVGAPHTGMKQESYNGVQFFRNTASRHAFVCYHRDGVTDLYTVVRPNFALAIALDGVPLGIDWAEEEQA